MSRLHGYSIINVSAPFCYQSSYHSTYFVTCAQYVSSYLLNQVFPGCTIPSFHRLVLQLQETSFIIIVL